MTIDKTCGTLVEKASYFRFCERNRVISQYREKTCEEMQREMLEVVKFG